MALWAITFLTVYVKKESFDIANGKNVVASKLEQKYNKKINIKNRKGILSDGWKDQLHVRRRIHIQLQKVFHLKGFKTKMKDIKKYQRFIIWKMERPIKIKNTRNPLPEKLKDHGTSTFDGIEVKVYQTVTMIWK